MITEKRLLQAAFALAGLVPVYAGASGAIRGAAFLGTAAPAAMDSHLRYLSGLLLAIGLAFWSAIPRIEDRTALIRLLTAMVVLGGLARALGLAVSGWPGNGMAFGLVMELAVTPLLCLWQGRVASHQGSSSSGRAAIRGTQAESTASPRAADSDLAA